MESMGKRHSYQGQMKSVTPHGITGLERVKEPPTPTEQRAGWVPNLMWTFGE
jgi:hypothetical protein